MPTRWPAPKLPSKSEMRTWGHAPGISEASFQNPRSEEPPLNNASYSLRSRGIIQSTLAQPTRENHRKNQVQTD